MKYLITGAPGWLGSEFVKALSGRRPNLKKLSNNLNIREIRCLIQPHISIKALTDINSDIKCIKGDIRNSESMIDFFYDSKDSTLFHIAGLIHPKYFTKEIWNLNYFGTKNILNLEPLRKKFESFGWSVKQIDGHDHKKLQKTLTTIPWKKNKPSILIANTVKGKGVSFMENNNQWHYKSPSKDQLKSALEELKNA